MKYLVWNTVYAILAMLIIGLVLLNKNAIAELPKAEPSRVEEKRPFPIGEDFVGTMKNDKFILTVVSRVNLEINKDNKTYHYIYKINLKGKEKFLVGWKLLDALLNYPDNEIPFLWEIEDGKELVIDQKSSHPPVKYMKMFFFMKKNAVPAHDFFHLKGTSLSDWGFFEYGGFTESGPIPSNKWK
jgi:hypothetical protein